MKRLILRGTFLAVVVGLGTIAVVEAKRVLHRHDDDARELPPITRRVEEARPIPLAVEGTETTVSPDQDPYPVDRRRDAAHVSPRPAAADPMQSYAVEANRAVSYNADADPEPNADTDQQNPYPEPRRLAQADPALPAAANPLAARRATPNLDAYAQQAGATADEQPIDDPADMAQEPVEPEVYSGPAPRSLPVNNPPYDEPAEDNFAPPANAVAASTFNAERIRPPASDAPATGQPADQGTGRPGEKQLEGAQAPSLTIEKRAPAEIQVGKPATFTITVRNVGQVPAQGVEVHDVIPQGTQLVSTTPQAKRSPQGELVWDLGNLKPNGEYVAQVQLLPLAEGEIGSVATLHFRAGASVRTTATRPQLNLEVSMAPRVMIGGPVQFRIKLSNPGTGAATGVVLSETVPQGLKHASGEELEFEVGTLRPGETRELELAMTATEAGPITNVLTAHSELNLKVEARTQFEIIAPALKIALSGPKRRYLERNATYTLAVNNPGTAPAKDIELVASLPKGLKFVEANNAGQYDAATGAVYWSLEELPPQETGTVTLTTTATEPGELKLHVKSKAQQGLSDELDETIVVEGLAAILFELVDVNDPIEVGADTSYEIRVINQGSKAASNVRVVALLPPQMQAVSADGPAKHVIDGQRVLFDPVAQLAPKADTTYTVKVKALEPGDLRMRVQIVTDEIRTPITKEESTRVYADE